MTKRAKNLREWRGEADKNQGGGERGENEWGEGQDGLVGRGFFFFSHFMVGTLVLCGFACTATIRRHGIGLMADKDGCQGQVPIQPRAIIATNRRCQRGIIVCEIVTRTWYRKSKI